MAQQSAQSAEVPKRKRGRPFGSKSKINKAIAEGIAERGVTPLEFMLSIMNSKKYSADMRLDAARSAAPYVHPKLAQVSHTGSINSELNVKLSDETRLDIARRVAFILQGGVKALEALTPTEVIDDVTGDDDDGGGDT